MKPSVKRGFEGSDNPILQKSLEEPDPPDPDFHENEIFMGWKKGTKDKFTSFRDAKWEEQNELNATAYREALHMFQKQFQGKGKNDTEELDEMFLDQGSASVIFRAGERGAGKSFNLRGEGNRSAISDVLTIHIDPAHEYYTNNYESGIQKKIVQKSAGLRPGEEPQPIETFVAMPKFIEQARKQSSLGMPGEQWTTTFQFSFSDLDGNDISYLFMKDVNRKSDTSKFKDYQKFTAKLSGAVQTGDIEDFDDAIDLAKKMQREGEFSYNERAGQIVDEIEQYQNWDFIGGKTLESQNNRFDSWEELVNEINCLTLSLEDDDNCPSHLEMAQFYISVLIKKIRSLRKSGKFDKPTNWIIDEIHKFVDDEDFDSRDEAPLAHWEIRKIIKEDRKIGFRVSMASQQVRDIPAENFLKQTDHMFIPMNMDKEDRRYLLQLYDVYSQGDNSRNKWKMIFDSMNEFEWFYMRKKTKEWCLLIPPAPLSNHLSE